MVSSDVLKMLFNNGVHFLAAFLCGLQNPWQAVVISYRTSLYQQVDPY